MTESGLLVVDVSAEQLPYPAHFDAMLDSQILGRELHEEDFRYFSRFAGHDTLLVDVGSNIGNSVVSAETACPGIRIIGFEPNVSLEPLLERAANFAPGFTYDLYGLSDVSGSAPLYIPVIDGRHIAGESSLSLSHFEDAVVKSRLLSYSSTGSLSLQSCILNFRRLDELQKVWDEAGHYKDVIMKIDVEGAEATVIDGGLEFIRRFLPIMLIEAGHDPEVAGRLEDIGFLRYLYQTDSASLRRARAAEPSLNSFFIHTDKEGLHL